MKKLEVKVTKVLYYNNGWGIFGCLPIDKYAEQIELNKYGNFSIKGKTFELIKDNTYTIEIKDDIDWIKKSISNSHLVDILPVIDYGLIFKLSAKSLIKIVCEIWNLGKRTSEIMELTSLARGTVIKYLKLGNEIGFCTYNSKEEVKKGSFYQIKKNNKPVLQFTLDHKFIREWNSVTEAAESLGISKGNISTVCTGKSKYSNGFIWKHK